MSIFRKSSARAAGNARGGVQTRIIMALVTLAIVGVFIVTFLGKKEESQKFHYANALTIAEYGLGEALMKLGENPKWKEGFESTEYKGGTYEVRLSTQQTNDTLFLTVESVGRSGSVERNKTIIFCSEVTPEGASTWRQHTNY